MVNSNLLSIKKLISQYHIRPQKRRGQNFLINPAVTDQMISSAQIKPQDVILEIGPGFGILTKRLAQSAKQVLTVEIDHQIVQALRIILSDYHHVKIIEGDILKIQSALINDLPPNYKIVANLPFQITSFFLRQFLECINKPKEMTLLVQKELGERICAQPGHMSLIAVAVQFYGQPRVIRTIGKENFWPSPEVDTAILRIENIGASFSTSLSSDQTKKFWRIVRIGFSARRKQLQNNLRAGLKTESVAIEAILDKIGLDKRIRAQDVSLASWLNLARELNCDSV